LKIVCQNSKEKKVIKKEMQNTEQQNYFKNEFLSNIRSKPLVFTLWNNSNEVLGIEANDKFLPVL